MALMTPSVIIESCKANKGFSLPRLNDQLFLHCKGFLKIENLEPYTEVKVLWLEQNSIADVRGLSAQQELVSLLLHNNALITLQNFEAPLRNLRILNISHNYLTNLRGLAEFCPLLETLQASHNHIACLTDCEAVWQLSGSLTSIDLSFNKIERYEAAANDEDEGRAAGQGEWAPAPSRDPSEVVSFFAKMPLVSVIYLQGNAITRSLKHYRRHMILQIPSLTYLDDRPVFADERRVVEAWGAGGEEAETLERSRIREEKAQHLSSCVRILTEKMENNREVRDKLTKQWEEKRNMELEWLSQRRRETSEAKKSLCMEEATRRGTMSAAEASGRELLEEAFNDGYAALITEETRRRRAYEQKLEVERVTEEVRREIEEEESRAEARQGSGQEDEAYEELVKTDQEVFNEMEEEIQQVLNHVHHSVSHRGQGGRPSDRDPNADWVAAREAGEFDRCASKAERKAHDAIRQTAQRLHREEVLRQEKREALWSQFEEWDRRQRRPSGNVTTSP